MVAFCAQGETIQPGGLAHGVEAIAPAGEQFVNIGLMTHVENKFVGRRVKDVMHGKSQLNHAKIRP